MVADPSPEGVLSRALELTIEEFWEDEDDLLTPLFRLVQEEPQVFVARLVLEAREGRADRAVRLWDQLMYIGDTAALIRTTAAVDRDLGCRLASRCFFDLRGCIETLGIAEAAALLKQAMASRDDDCQTWALRAKEDLWRMPPRGIWDFFFHLHADDGLPELSGNDMEWLWAGGPEAILRTDPMRFLTPEEETLLRDLVDGFVDHALAIVAAGIDPRPWLRWISNELYHCHPQCCRPPLIVVAMADRGWFRV